LTIKRHRYESEPTTKLVRTGLHMLILSVFIVLSAVLVSLAVVIIVSTYVALGQAV